jgi:hypothetical protein
MYTAELELIPLPDKHFGNWSSSTDLCLHTFFRMLDLPVKKSALPHRKQKLSASSGAVRLRGDLLI